MIEYCGSLMKEKATQLCCLVRKVRITLSFGKRIKRRLGEEVVNVVSFSTECYLGRRILGLLE